MGRVKGKGKKLAVTSHEDPGSGEEDKIPAQKRRGRPLKPFKSEIDDDGDDDDEHVNQIHMDNKTTIIDDVKKRKQNTATKDKHTALKEETTLVSTKPNGFRHVGSRRKNKPRRAPQVGVELHCLVIEQGC